MLIHGVDDVEYILEEADEFEREVAILGRSDKYMNFLQKRAEEPGEKPISEVNKRTEYCMSTRFVVKPNTREGCSSRRDI